ncbi:MAG: hypothetical protein LBJ00_11025 [Planctomycetaceae bacterium]|nr:hypothetical protein [Planctomycetaceae bacterium]
MLNNRFIYESRLQLFCNDNIPSIGFAPEQPLHVVVLACLYLIPEAEHAGVASRSDCSRAKPVALPATV